jgi:hypothetical protein
MSLSVSVFAQRLAFINAQSEEVKSILKPRIADRAFWQFASHNVTSSSNKNKKR